MTNPHTVPALDDLLNDLEAVQAAYETVGSRTEGEQLDAKRREIRAKIHALATPASRAGPSEAARRKAWEAASECAADLVDRGYGPCPPFVRDMLDAGLRAAYAVDGLAVGERQESASALPKIAAPSALERLVKEMEARVRMLLDEAKDWTTCEHKNRLYARADEAGRCLPALRRVLKGETDGE